ncbi:MAG: hypothetical protein KDK63_00950 [Chlamydiia bacterium]|nr:hypothetical protein [Chlamydiia bacterium]
MPEKIVIDKECDEIIAEIFRQSSAPIVTVEALRDLHPYDEYLGWPIHFDFLFEKMERSPIPYFLRVPKRGERSPKQKEVETFDLAEQDIL